MDNSVYITLSRQLALFRDMDVTSNNIANGNTTGYGAERILFKSYLNKDINQGISNPMSFAHDISSYRDTEVGSFTSTGNALDVAIQNKGYFAVETPLGTRYTRAGNFQLDTAGTLVTVDGNPVLDASGQRVVFPEDTVSIDIGSTGNIKVNDQDFGSIGVFEFANEQVLERLNGGMYKTDVTPAVVEDARVVQGALESSNVQPVKEMTHMIEVSRAVSSTAKFIETMYDLQRKASNIWAQQG